MKKYHLVFRNAGGIFTAFYSDIFIKGGYGDFGLVSTYEKPVGQLFISKQDEERANKIGLRLYSNQERIKSLIKKGRKLSEELNYVSRFPSKVWLKTRSDAEIKKLLKRLCFYAIRHLRIYRFLEAMVVGGVEREIEESICKKVDNPVLVYQYLRYLLNSSNKNTIVQKRQKILTGLKLSRRIKNLCDSTRKTGKEKLFFRKAINRWFDSMELLLKEISRRRNLTIEQIKSCLYKEVIPILDKKKISFSKINQRKEYFVAVKGRAVGIFYTGKRAKTILSRFKIGILESKKIKEFRGSVANPGLTRGRAKLFTFGIGKEVNIRLNKQILEMKKGDVLVAETTGPELILACKKASAIIADEGGINSHAAIVSREFDIPCVVGTQIATQVLKDGDFVEVDANKGMVKILKRAKR